jgi:hypothetical protein
MIGLGQSRRVLELVAKDHRLKESTPDPEKLPNSGQYPITVLTPTLFTTFYVTELEPFSDGFTAPLPSTILPNQALLAYAKDPVSKGQRFYNEPLPGREELKAAKVARKQQQLTTLRQFEDDKRIWEELKKRKEAGEDIVLPDPPLNGRQKRRREKMEAQNVDDEGPNDKHPDNHFDVIPPVIEQFDTNVEDSDKV